MMHGQKNFKLSGSFWNLIKTTGLCNVLYFTLLIHSITKWHQVVSLGNTQQMSVNEIFFRVRTYFSSQASNMMSPIY